MSEFITIASRADLKPGRGITVRRGEQTIALFDVGGEIFAIDAICPHKGGPLGEGYAEGCTVYCPLHGWSFDLKTGVCRDVAEKRVVTYPVRVSGEEVQVQLENKL